jgi:hypothetical protein
VAHTRCGERGGFGEFSTAHSNGTNKVIDTPCISMLSSSVFAKLQPRSVPSNHSPGFHTDGWLECLQTSYPKVSNGRSYPLSFQSLGEPGFPSNSNGVLCIPFVSLPLPTLSSATRGCTPSFHFSRPPLDSISSISRHPSHFSSTTYKMPLPQLLCFENHPFLWGCIPLTRLHPASRGRESRACPPYRASPELAEAGHGSRPPYHCAKKATVPQCS